MLFEYKKNRYFINIITREKKHKVLSGHRYWEEKVKNLCLWLTIIFIRYLLFFYFQIMFLICYGKWGRLHFWEGATKSKSIRFLLVIQLRYLWFYIVHILILCLRGYEMNGNKSWILSYSGQSFVADIVTGSGFCFCTKIEYFISQIWSRVWSTVSLEYSFLVIKKIYFLTYSKFILSFYLKIKLVIFL